MKLQQINTVASDLVAGITWVRMLGGNPRRTRLIVSWQSGPFVQVATRDMGAGQSGMLMVANSGTILKRSDYGEFITGEIWYASIGNVTQAIATELYTIR